MKPDEHACCQAFETAESRIDENFSEFLFPTSSRQIRFQFCSKVQAVKAIFHELSMNDHARKLFEEMVQDCGSSIYRMQSSCEMYISQYLAQYPDEQQILKLALRCGVPDRIMKARDPEGYEEFLSQLKDRFAEVSEQDGQVAAWAVEAWASALGRSPGAFSEVAATRQRDRRVYADSDEPDPSTQTLAATAMAAIVGCGGFFGGLVATLLIPCFLWAADFNSMLGEEYQRRTAGGSSAAHSELMVFLVFGLIGVVVGAVGAAAAIAAWFFAGGNVKPWSTFSVAFGTAFTMVWIVGFVPLIVLPAKPILFFISVFSAVYKSAARGGQY